MNGSADRRTNVLNQNLCETVWLTPNPIDFLTRGEMTSLGDGSLDEIRYRLSSSSELPVMLPSVEVCDAKTYNVFTIRGVNGDSNRSTQESCVVCHGDTNDNNNNDDVSFERELGVLSYLTIARSLTAGTWVVIGDEENAGMFFRFRVNLCGYRLVYRC